MSSKSFQAEDQHQQLSCRRPTSSQRQTSFSNLRKKSGSVTLAILLAVQACSVGSVSARPNGMLRNRTVGETSFPMASSVAFASSTSAFPSSSAATSTVTGMTTNEADKDMPILLEHNPPSPTSTVISSMASTMTSQSSMYAQPSADAMSEKQQKTNDVGDDDTPAKRQEDDDGNDGSSGDEADINDDDGSGSEDQSDSEESQSCASSDDSEGEGSDAEGEGQNKLNAFPILSTVTSPNNNDPLGQVQNVLPIKRDSWFSSSPSKDGKPASIQKDDAALYGLMKRMFSSSEVNKVTLERRVLDMLSELEKAGEKRQEEASLSSTTNPSPTSSSCPVMSTIQPSASPTAVETQKSEQGATSPQMNNQWIEHKHQNDGKDEQQQNTKRDDTTPTVTDPTTKQRHQLLATAMNDWNYVSSWLSNHLPVELHKQVEQALRNSDAGQDAKAVGTNDPSSPSPPSAAVQKAVADAAGHSSSSEPSYVSHGQK